MFICLTWKQLCLQWHRPTETTTNRPIPGYKYTPVFCFRVPDTFKKFDVKYPKKLSQASEKCLHIEYFEQVAFRQTDPKTRDRHKTEASSVVLLPLVSQVEYPSSGNLNFIFIFSGTWTTLSWIESCNVWIYLCL